MLGTLLLSGAKALLFGGSSAGKKGHNNVMEVVSSVGKYIDQRNYTEEERAEDNKGQIQNLNKFIEQTVHENSGRSITRRELALLIMRMAVLLTVFSVAVWKFDKEWAEFILAWFQVWWPIIAGVGLFFFGTHLARGMKGKN